MILNVSVTGAEEIAAHFGKIGDEARQKIFVKVNDLTINLMNKAKGKVSGDVLNVKTGQLRANIIAQTPEDEAGAITGKVVVGKNVKYAAIHEYGGVIKHPGGTAYLIDPKTGVSRWISNKSDLADKLPRTKAHDIPMPERSYLRSSLVDMKQEISEGLTQAVQDAIKST